MILWLLMQTVTVDVVCIVIFTVHTSYFFFTFLLGRWISGIPSTSFCSLAIPLIFSFSIIVPAFFRCLICWFCRCNPFTVTTIWNDLLFLVVGFFRRWWYFTFVFRTSFSIKTILSLLLSHFYTYFCLLFNWISVVFLGICFIIFTSEMISFVLNGFGELCSICFVYSVRCSILLVVFGNLERFL